MNVVHEGHDIVSSVIVLLKLVVFTALRPSGIKEHVKLSRCSNPKFFQE